MASDATAPPSIGRRSGRLHADPPRFALASQRSQVTPLRIAFHAGFADADGRKYDRRPRNENVAEVYLYRLTARR